MCIRDRIIASGGLSSMDELTVLSDQAEGRIAGVICGRALYENRINLKDALKLLRDRIDEC